jgi:hypothetical protein
MNTGPRGDSHGQSEIGFGVTRLLGVDLLPRIKRVNKARLYRPAVGEPGAWPRLEPTLTRPIRWDLIAAQYDQMIKYATAIRAGTASTEAILRRFTKANAVHPAYQRASPPRSARTRCATSCSPGLRPRASTTRSSSPTAATPPASPWRSTPASPWPTPSSATTTSSAISPYDQRDHARLGLVTRFLPAPRFTRAAHRGAMVRRAATRAISVRELTSSFFRMWET